MSWGEVEKINSWAKKGVPLNHLIWLNDYKTYGKDSYVFQDKDILHELYKSVRISANDNAIRVEAFNAIIDNNYSIIGAYFGAINDIRQSNAAVDWSSLTSLAALIASNAAMTAIAASETAMIVLLTSEIVIKAVAASETAMTAIAVSETAMSVIAASNVAMTAIATSETAMSALVASETAMTVIVVSEIAMAAIAASKMAMSSIVASETAMAVLMTSETAIKAVAKSKTAMSAVAESETAMTLLESSNIFKTTVASNPDIQTLSTTASSTLSNVFAISAEAKSINYLNGSTWCYSRASVNYIPHGSTNSVTAIESIVSTDYNKVTDRIETVNKFVKSLAVGSVEGSPTTNVKYIQFDNVV